MSQLYLWNNEMLFFSFILSPLLQYACTKQVKWFSRRFVASFFLVCSFLTLITSTLSQPCHYSFPVGALAEETDGASEFTLADYDLGSFCSPCVLSISILHKGWMSKALSVIFGPLPIVTCQNLGHSHNLISIPTSSSPEGWVFLFIFSPSPPYLVQRTLDQASAFFFVLIRWAPPLLNSLSYYLQPWFKDSDPIFIASSYLLNPYCQNTLPNPFLFQQMDSVILLRLSIPTIVMGERPAIDHIFTQKVNFHPTLKALFDQSWFFPGQLSTLVPYSSPFLSPPSHILSFFLKSQVLLHCYPQGVRDSLDCHILLSMKMTFVFLSLCSRFSSPLCLVTFLYFLFFWLRFQFASILLKYCVSWFSYFLNSLQELCVLFFFFFLFPFPKSLHTFSQARLHLVPECLLLSSDKNINSTFSNLP